jgi:hypothetical protein
MESIIAGKSTADNPGTDTAFKLSRLKARGRAAEDAGTSNIHRFVKGGNGAPNMSVSVPLHFAPDGSVRTVEERKKSSSPPQWLPSSQVSISDDINRFFN